MIEIKKVIKSEVPNFLENNNFWQNSFYVTTKHRLISHFNNPNIDNDDIVLLIAYLNKECVGYMGVFMDKIAIDSHLVKIGWLSTWWLDSKARGTGIGKEILRTMFAENNGSIGISHFTDSAKRVYDKSGYFTKLKNFVGVDFIMRLDLPALFHYRLGTSRNNVFFQLIGDITSAFDSLRLSFYRRKIRTSIHNVSVEYLAEMDTDVSLLVEKWNSSDLSPKSASFFDHLKKDSWILNVPCLDLSIYKDYEFSSFAYHFEISLIKVIRDEECIGFVVLQNRNRTTKLLFSYFDKKFVFEVAQVILLHALDSNSINLVCYVDEISDVIKRNKLFIRKKETKFSSIISESYGNIDYEGYRVQYGDGDNCFT